MVIPRMMSGSKKEFFKAGDILEDIPIVFVQIGAF